MTDKFVAELVRAGDWVTGHVFGTERFDGLGWIVHVQSPVEFAESSEILPFSDAVAWMYERYVKFKRKYENH